MGHTEKKKHQVELVIGFIHKVPLKKTSLFNKVDVASPSSLSLSSLSVSPPSLSWNTCSSSPALLQTSKHCNPYYQATESKRGEGV